MSQRYFYPAEYTTNTKPNPKPKPNPKKKKLTLGLATRRSDMSLRQNHIHVTRGDSPILFPRVCDRREGPRLVYLQTCRSDMLQVHVTRGDGMCVRHFVAATFCRRDVSHEFKLM